MQQQHARTTRLVTANPNPEAKLTVDQPRLKFSYYAYVSA